MKPHGIKLNDHVTRYRLSEQWFIDRDTLHGNDYKYKLWQSGAGQEIHTTSGRSYRIAGLMGVADTLGDALDIYREMTQ